MVSIPNAILSWNGFIWTKYSRTNQVKFVEDWQPLKKLKEYGLLQADHTPSKFLKTVFQTLLGPFLKTLSHMAVCYCCCCFFFFGNVQTNEMAPNCHITDILTIPLTYLKIFKSSNTSFISIPFKNNAEPPGATFNFSNS